ncbi:MULTISPECIES: AAA family ATPase [Achromobacter]|uniref:AAA family ATPase n=1 Tax=Achromobacter spanius TaxID=217203 RepID=A0ABY8GVX8_9BURK|nr:MULTISPECIES: AAA family ATPase [Achromobacter]WAI81753.1 AAA family ATPase [Achromobacter spanius]WEX97271.1 AAA family ATPase [Achromobacter sp. SS2-2022]WFP09013.1 AAA family ATPase [Achromobacter spanius]
MINAQRVEALLKDRYPDLESVSRGVFRGVDRFGARDYAIRYFDLNDRLATTANSLRSYQEQVLSPMYFSSDVATDLRWNHYLYFITSDDEADRSEFSRLKAKVEADREYARKHVVREGEIASWLANAQALEPPRSLPIDLATSWSNTLEQHGLSFILDNDITVPEAVRRIVAGAKDKALRPISPVSLLAAERAAASCFIEHLTIKGFRTHPEEKEHLLGRVNLIVGSNGVGKTSLLEAIEFAYCGKNRRSSPLLDSTSITLDLLGVGDKLSSTTDSGRLRARHSNWYAKAELKAITIQDSFGKFNFLDTDAAVDLSVSASSEQIGTDVTRLVLGATAESLADRLRRVLKQLQDELKGLRRDRESNRQMKVAAQIRVDAIKAAPKLSDSLFLELLVALRGQGWSQPPEEKSQLEFLRQRLQEATSAIALVRHASINVLHSEPESALRLLTNLNDEAGKAEDLDQRAKAARLAQVNARREAQAAAALSAATEALIPYARTNFPQLVKKASECRDRVRTWTTRLSPVPDLSDTSAIQEFLGTPVIDAIDSVESDIGTHQRRLEAAQTSLQALEKTQSTMTVLRQRLLGAAQDILQRSAMPDQCPLCRTEFEEGQLVARMMADVEVGASEQASLLQAEISSASEAIVNARAVMATLHPLREFFGNGALTITVAKAFEQVKEERTAFERDRQELDTIHAQARQLQSDGLSSEDLSSKLLNAGMAELPLYEELQRIQSNHKQRLEILQRAEKTAVHESEVVRQECDAMAERLSIEALGDTDNLAKLVKGLISDAEAALGARQILASIMTISTEKTAEEIALNLANIQQLLAQVTTGLAQEVSNDKALNDETGNVDKLAKKIEGSDAKITRASDTERVLATLAEQSSGGELANQILTENAAEIARTFASIHMPNEFEIQIAQGKLVIIRRSTGAEVQLDHMSTGQRAAFALSLFLAMNGRLRSGPPVLLFDDPVAHIDDINMLSFLDHLRQLVIGGSRQIFFATADTKLAGLFRHKFRFLGDEFKELRLSRTS